MRRQAGSKFKSPYLCDARLYEWKIFVLTVAKMFGSFITNESVKFYFDKTCIEAISLVSSDMIYCICVTKLNKYNN